VIEPRADEQRTVTLTGVGARWRGVPLPDTV